jgi:hypothetical protein
MGIMDKIHSLREKIGQKLQEPCPTDLLLYIATGRQVDRDVDPWYSTIKNLCDGRDRKDNLHHRAMICALYPEMEKAVELFEEKMNEKAMENGGVAKEDALFIENYVRVKCNLKYSYNFLGVHVSDEKREKYEQLFEKFNVEDVKKKTSNMLGIVKVIAEGLAREGLPANEIRRDLRRVNNALLSTIDENAEVPHIKESRDHHNIGAILSLRRLGALDEQYNVVDYNELKFSNVIRKFESRFGDFDLRDKITIPEKENGKTLGMGGKNLSHEQNNP